MRAFKRSRIAVPLISIVAAFAFSAQAQEQQHKPPPQGQGRPAAPAARPAAPGAHPPGAGQVPRTGQVRGPQGPHGARVARGNFPQRNFGGHPYHGRLAWGGGRWRH